MKVLCTIGLALMLSTTAYARREPPDTVVTMFDTLLAAVAGNDLDKLESVCDAAMREAITPELLQKVHDQLGGLLKAGYTRTFLGSNTQGKITSYLWRLAAKTEGTPEFRATVSIRNGKVAGFFMH